MFDAGYFALGFHSKGIPLEAGLTAAELSQIELENRFQFPPDLRRFLHEILPVGDKFPNWRQNIGSGFLNKQDDWVVNGFLFDVEHNKMWFQEWGERPSELRDALYIARAYLQVAPRLIPIYSHRFIPVDPSEEGNPILSVMQTDIICYGNDLSDYFCKEFGFLRSKHLQFRETIKPIDFWGMFIDEGNEGGV